MAHYLLDHSKSYWMNYSIETLPQFDKDVKKLKKRFPNIKADLALLLKELTQNPELGTHLENSIFKIRLKNSSIPTGKRGGFRVITYYLCNHKLYLVTIYSKTDTDSILTPRLKAIIAQEKI